MTEVQEERMEDRKLSWSFDELENSGSVDGNVKAEREKLKVANLEEYVGEFRRNDGPEKRKLFELGEMKQSLIEDREFVRLEYLDGSLDCAHTSVVAIGNREFAKSWRKKLEVVDEGSVVRRGG
jgi:hypothetical protein